ncbi:NAD-dependent epimerase [Mesonia maritima]|uniref:UDP-glucuronate 4-epimerase n=1 Tax=Mesonia maritima TaxID=1793873 RepID=A0ABU1K849_9FLAO|nr:NAD-dependent epimerase [Mesonia maritima]MDR6301789.1 UDP-glucuronate 4-epimerase [Mesonia maritima]
MENKTILVTGAAGFIGFHLCLKLLKENYTVIGLDNINDYYNVQLKYDRLKELGVEQEEAQYFNNWSTSASYQNFSFIRLNLEDRENLPKIFKEKSITRVCNLAAQAGVRYSLENPEAYIDSNIVGFLNVLECCRNYNVEKLVYASSSSVYGNNQKVPFSEKDNVDHPISVYAATKKSNELLAHTYSHLYGIQTTGLRFFTVYGPWGRPDMAMFLFTDAILKDKPIKVFNNGNLSRDFTYIDDIIAGVEKTLLKPQPDDKTYSLYNIGNGNPVKLLDFIESIEKEIGKTAQKQMLPMQPGDVEKTWADTTTLENDFNYKPNTLIQDGIRSFVSWYKDYYN